MIVGLQLGRSSTPGRPTQAGEAPVVETPFTDLGTASAAHRDDIRRIYGLGITKGTSPTAFSPLTPMSLQQAASFLARLYEAVEGEEPPVVEPPYADLGPASAAHRDDIRRIYGTRHHRRRAAHSHLLRYLAYPVAGRQRSWQGSTPWQPAVSLRWSRHPSRTSTTQRPRSETTSAASTGSESPKAHPGQPSPPMPARPASRWRRSWPGPTGQ